VLAEEAKRIAMIVLRVIFRTVAQSCELPAAPEEARP